MKTKQKHHAVTAALWIALLSILLIGGALAYIYSNTDETVVPEAAVTLNGEPLFYSSATWNTPVFDGLVYKTCSVAVDRAESSQVINEPTFALRAPAQDVAEIIVRDSMGTEMTAVEQPGEYKYTAERNGVYTYELVVTVPKTQGAAYGEYRYTGRFTVDVQPAIHFSSETVRQGGVLTVLVTGMAGLPTPELEQNLSYAHFAKHGTGYAAVIGVGYNATPGAYVVNVSCGELRATQTITVEATEFERQDMTIDDDVAASTNTAAAAAEWRAAIWTLYETADDTIYWKDDFRVPLNKVELNTSYGLFRYTNGATTAERHAGIDLDGETGDTVYAPNNGRVAYAGFLTMTGNTVVIEHGAGLKSYFFHMDSLTCKTDEMVNTGDVIGAVGSTGYSTGPHLHYEVKIGRQSINPMALFDGTSSIYSAG